jgi:hypothetical protein
MYYINPHVNGREDARFPEDFPMLESKEQTKIHRDENGDVFVYTTTGNTYDIMTAIAKFEIRESQERLRAKEDGS